MGLSVSQGHFGGLMREHGLIRGWAYPRDSTVPKNSADRPMGLSDSKGASDECLCGHELVRQSRCTATSTQSIFLVLQSIHKKMGSGSGELPYLAVFRDFIVHSAVLRTLKFEKGSKKGA